MYARFADDMVILVDSHRRHQRLRQAIERRVREELAKLEVEVNEEKSRNVDLTQGESFGFLGFEFRRILSRRGRWMPLLIPKMKKRTALLRQLKGIFRHFRSQLVNRLIDQINPILRGWVNYFAIGNSSRCFSFIRSWVEKKIRPRSFLRAIAPALDPTRRKMAGRKIGGGKAADVFSLDLADALRTGIEPVFP